MANIHHGRNIKKFREAIGLTQAELGDKIGLTQQAVSSLESQALVDEERLQAIWKHLCDYRLLRNVVDDCQTVTNIENNSGIVNTNMEGDMHTNNPLAELMKVYEDRIAEIKESYSKEILLLEAAMAAKNKQ